MGRAGVQNTVELAAIGSLLIRNKCNCFCVIVFLAASGKFWESYCLLAGSVMGKHNVLFTSLLSPNPSSISGSAHSSE